MTIPDHDARTQAVDRFAELLTSGRAAIAQSKRVVAQSKRLVASSRDLLFESKRLLGTMEYPVSPRMPVLHDRLAVAARVAEALRAAGFDCDTPSAPVLH